MASEKKDFYQVLGVEKGSDAKEIKKAYRKLARQHHPDVNADDTDAAEKFRAVSEAYEVLGDSEKRAIFDKYGDRYSEYEAWKKAGGEATGVPLDAYMSGIGSRTRRGAGVGADGAANPYRTASAEDMADIFGAESPYADFFSSIFQGSGAAARPTGPARGRDIEYLVQVTLEEAFGGTKRVLELATEQSGAQRRRLEVSLPAGVSDGSRVRLAGQGYPGYNAGPAGDLYLVVETLPHCFFERQGSNLDAKVRVPVATAILGGEVTIPTIKGGKLAMKVPELSQNGGQIKLRGQGMPTRVNGTERGDLYVTLDVTLPTNLTAEQRTALEHFAHLLNPEAASDLQDIAA